MVWLGHVCVLPCPISSKGLMRPFLERYPDQKAASVILRALFRSLELVILGTDQQRCQEIYYQ